MVSFTLIFHLLRQLCQHRSGTRHTARAGLIGYQRHRRQSRARNIDIPGPRLSSFYVCLVYVAFAEIMRQVLLSLLVPHSRQLYHHAEPQRNLVRRAVITRST